MAKHLIIIIYFGLCLFLGVSVKAQISHGGQPLPLTATKSLTEDMFITMPPFDLAEQLRHRSFVPDRQSVHPPTAGER